MSQPNQIQLYAIDQNPAPIPIANAGPVDAAIPAAQEALQIAVPAQQPAIQANVVVESPSLEGIPTPLVERALASGATPVRGELAPPAVQPRQLPVQAVAHEPVAPRLAAPAPINAALIQQPNARGLCDRFADYCDYLHREYLFFKILFGFVRVVGALISIPLGLALMGLVIVAAVVAPFAYAFYVAGRYCFCRQEDNEAAAAAAAPLLQNAQARAPEQAQPDPVQAQMVETYRIILERHLDSLPQEGENLRRIFLTRVRDLDARIFSGPESISLKLLKNLAQGARIVALSPENTPTALHAYIDDINRVSQLNDDSIAFQNQAEELARTLARDPTLNEALRTALGNLGAKYSNEIAQLPEPA